MFSFSSGVGRGAQRARLEGPRANYAPPGFRIGMTRALRERQLPTKRCHAALPSRVTRAYQPDSSSKPPARQPRAGALGKSSIHLQGILGCQHRPRDRGRRHNPLDSRSFHISYAPHRPGTLASKPETTTLARRNVRCRMGAVYDVEIPRRGVAALPALRPPPHVRDAPARPGRADHLRGGTARPREADDDAGLLRALDPVGRQAVDQPARGTAGGWRRVRW